MSIMRHVRNYASAGMVSALVGLASFPIMARNLSVDDYGIIGLITASATLATAFGKLGIQHAIVRYYAEAMHSDEPNDLLSFHTTVFALLGSLSVVTALIWVFTGYQVIPRFIDNAHLGHYFLIMSGMIVLRMVGSANWNLLRARQESGAVGLSTIIGRVTYLAILLALLFSGYISLYSLLLAFVIAELAGVWWAVHAYRQWSSFSWPFFSSDTARQLLRFGAPLMVLESLSVGLRLIDRYMIGAVLGEKPLGLYAASYNLCSYVELVITASLAAAIRPMYSDIWAREGREATVSFLERGLHLYFMIGVPFLVVFNLVAPELLHFLASDRYEAGTSIIPWISTAILLDGALIFLSAGLYFLGSTNTILKWGLLSGMINFAGNYMVIPHFGIVGAASVTLFAFLVFASGLMRQSLSLLSFSVSWKKPLLLLLICLTLCLPIALIDLGGPLPNLVVRGALSSVLCGSVLLIIDAEVRVWCLQQWQRLLVRLRGDKGAANEP